MCVRCNARGGLLGWRLSPWVLADFLRFDVGGSGRAQDRIFGVGAGLLTADLRLWYRKLRSNHTLGTLLFRR
jgi:hypothetical protein